MLLEDSKRLVLKVGSTLLIDPRTNRINIQWLQSFIKDVVTLKSAGIKVVIVSSGAVGLGCNLLNFKRQQLTIDKQQAAAAVGQIRLLHQYQVLLKQSNLIAAQVLLSLDDSENRKRYLNARNTLHTLLENNVIPIVNENDTIATAEIRYGDNDRLAARVAQMIDADTLVLLSDIDGFYTADPKLDKTAQLIPEVRKLSDNILKMAHQSSSNLGSGGMITKLAAANITMTCGCKLLITAGKPLNPLCHYRQHQKGTWFIPSQSRIKAKKAWLNQHLQPKGIIDIDQGACQAIFAGKSLLAVGIIDTEGSFIKGDAVDIRTNARIIARGLTNYSSEDINIIKGHPTRQIAALLNYDGIHEIIHCDNLSLLTQTVEPKS